MVLNPLECGNRILSAAMAIAPAALPKGRYREADLAWRQGKSLGDIAAIVGSERSVVRKRLARASERLEGLILEGVRSALSGRARCRVDAYRRGDRLLDPELSALAEDVARVLNGSLGDRDPDEVGPHAGESRIF